jgi:uncharacterized SAM-binding protein YcdF (DUF218 family)
MAVLQKTRRTFWRRSARWAGPFILAAVVTFLIGFATFAERVSRMAAPAEVKPADAIVVLTGGQSRLGAAIELLADGKGKRLLISGVYVGTSKLAIRDAIGADRALFDCCVDIGYEAQDTVGNASETDAWLTKNSFHSVILVTNNYHMKRSLLEMRRLNPALDIRPYPVVNSDLTNGKWMLSTEAMRVLLAEYMKYLAAVSRRVLPVPASLASIMRI